MNLFLIGKSLPKAGSRPATPPTLSRLELPRVTPHPTSMPLRTTCTARHRASKDRQPAPTAGTEAPARRYLEGLKLTCYLLGDVLAVLTKPALLGGLGDRVLELSFQLQGGDTSCARAQSSPGRHPFTPRKSEQTPEGSLTSFTLDQVL